jgi:hypothetical protein
MVDIRAMAASIHPSRHGREADGEATYQRRVTPVDLFYLNCMVVLMILIVLFCLVGCR